MAQQLGLMGDEVSRVILLDVPDAPSALTPIADAVDRVGALVGIARHDRLRLSGGLARLPHHGERFVTTPAKLAFLTRRVGKLLRFKRSGAGRAGAAGADPRLDAWKRRVEAYVPRRYDGPVSVLVTASAGQGGASGWNVLAPRITVSNLAGTHLTCITDFIEDTALAVAGAIENHIDSRASSSTAAIMRSTRSRKPRAASAVCRSLWGMARKRAWASRSSANDPSSSPP
jgi:hypothetical protein